MSSAPSGLPLLRAAILHALGLTVAASCTSRPLGDTAEGASGGTTAGGTTAGGTTLVTSTAGPSSATGEATAAGSVGSSGGGPGSGTGTTGGAGTTGTVDPSTSMPVSTGETTLAPDLPCVPMPEIGTPLMPADVVEFPGCEGFLADGCFDYMEICVPLPRGARSCDACAPNCLDALPQICNGFWINKTACGPFLVEAQCCHVVEYGWNCSDGRPFLVDGTARTARPVGGRAWLGEVEVASRALVEELDGAGRAELAALWTADALAEHASIASFARFTLQLLAHAAPPALVQEACAAQADEVAHARAAFALAALYADAPVGPGPLEIAGALAGAQDLVALVTAVVLEGCVGETLAANEVDLAARTCADPWLAATLRGIAADERRHAALAWRTLQWALVRGGAVAREAAREAFARASSGAPPADRLPEALLRRHGRVPAAERGAAAAACLREVVLPCALALLAMDRPMAA